MESETRKKKKKVVHKQIRYTPNHLIKAIKLINANLAEWDS